MAPAWPCRTFQAISAIFKSAIPVSLVVLFRTLNGRSKQSSLEKEWILLHCSLMQPKHIFRPMNVEHILAPADKLG